MIRVLVGALAMSVILPVAHAVSKDAQELITLREKHAPLFCELTSCTGSLARRAKPRIRPGSRR